MDQFHPSDLRGMKANQSAFTRLKGELQRHHVYIKVCLQVSGCAAVV